jgi:four helix bundle protein
MSDVKSYRDLIAWQKSIELARKVYLFTKVFPKEEMYGLTSQARRAAVSVPANIAEGHARNHRKEYVQFLGIAKGSLAELQTYFVLSEKLKFVEPSQTDELVRDSEEIEKILAGLTNSLTPSP